MTILEKDTRRQAGCTVSDLRVALTGRGLDVVDEISIELRPGEVVGLVGESGSGKTTAGTALLGYARRGAFIERGTLLFEGQDVLALPWEQVREIRGLKIAYVPQDPGAALNPAIRIGRQIVELLELHDIGTAEERLARCPGRAARGRACPTTTSSWPATRTSSPAARCSGSRWRWRSCPGPRCWCSTSRPPAWTSPPRAWCCGPWPSCAAATGSRRCTSRTTWPWWPTSPTGSRSCTPGGSSSSGRARRCSASRRTRTPGRCWTPSRTCRRPARSPESPARTPGPGRRPSGLPVPRPLRVRPGPLPRDRSAGRPGRPGPHREVPARRRDRHLGHQPGQHPPTPTRTRRGTSS